MKRRHFMQSAAPIMAAPLLAWAPCFAACFADRRQISALSPRDESGHRFVIYGDCCSGIPGSDFEKNHAQVNAMVTAIEPQPEFIAFLGDAISGYVTDYDELRRQWHYWQTTEMAWARERNIKLYQSTSNHNTYDDGSEDVFRAVHADLPQNGPSGQKGLAYWFRHGNLLYVSTHQPHGQMPIDHNWLERILAENADAQFKFVAGHYPVFPVNGYYQHVDWPVWCFPPDQRRPFWDILVRHRVRAYLTSHVIAFDVQVHDGVLQILSGGAGTSWGPGGFMPARTEYFHAVQMAVDQQGLRYQVHDVSGQVRECLSWPPELAPVDEWQVASSEDLSSALRSFDPQRELIAFRIRGIAGSRTEHLASQTLLCGGDANEGVDPVWIGIDGDNGRVRVHLVPISGEGWQVWQGPLIAPGSAFEFQVAIHPGMGPGGVLFRAHPSADWTTLESMSSKGSENLQRPVQWFVGQGSSGPSDRAFAGNSLAIDYARQPLTFVPEVCVVDPSSSPKGGTINSTK